MSHENVDALKRFVRRWNLGDSGVTPDELDPDFELSGPFSSIAGEPYRGVAGYKQWRADITNHFDEWQMNLSEIRTLSDTRLLAVGTAHVRGRGSGIEIDQPAAALVEFRDGRMLRVAIFASADDALQAAALEAS